MQHFKRLLHARELACHHVRRQNGRELALPFARICKLQTGLE
jgi:hypothetical protein